MASVKHLANLTTYNDVQGDLTLTGDLIANGLLFQFPTSLGLSGQVLTTNGLGQAQWQTVASSSLTDFKITSPSNGQALIYNSGSGKWINTTLTNASVGLGNVANLSPSQLFTAPTITGPVVINGDLTVNGSQTTTGPSVTTSPTLTLNNGEAGAGVSAGAAGVIIDRGTLTNYEFEFVEASQTFRIGLIGSTQAVATREDTPISGAIPAWNASTLMLDTSIGLTASEVTQLKNIGVLTISATQWGYLNALNQNLATGQSVTFASETLQASSNQIVLQPGGSGNTLTLTATNPASSSRTLTIPDPGSGTTPTLLAYNGSTAYTTVSGPYIKDDTVGGILALGFHSATGQSGSRGTWIGVASGNTVGTGTDNTSLGYNTGNALTSGHDNVLLGSTAGQLLQTGFANTFIGSGAGSSATSTNYAIAIGYGAVNTTNLTAIIGGPTVGSGAITDLSSGMIDTCALGSAFPYKAINLGASNQASFTSKRLTSVAVNAGGTGYQVGDVLGITNTGATVTNNVQLTVTSAPGGVISGLSITTPGDYVIAPSTLTGNALTGGHGTSGTVNLTFTQCIEQWVINVPARTSTTITVPDPGSSTNIILGTSTGGQTITNGLTVDSINIGSFVPQSINTTDLGSTSLPFKSLWLGTSSTNQANLVVSGLAASRTYTIPEVGTNANFIMSTTSATNVVQQITSGLSINEATYSTGTASQSGATVTGSGTSWSLLMVGGLILFSGGQRGIITSVNTISQTLTVNSNQSVSSTTYTIYYNGIHTDSNANSVLISARGTWIAGLLKINCVTPSPGNVEIGSLGSYPGFINIGNPLSTLTLDGTINFNTALLPSTAGGVALGSSSLPFSSLWLGNASSNNAQITGTFSGARTLTVPDPGASANFIMSTSSGGQTITGGLTAGTLTVTGASVAPSLQNTTDLGTTSVPFKSLWLGTSSTNQANIIISGIASLRTYTLPDAGASANIVLDQGNYTIGGTWSFSNTTTFANIIDSGLSVSTLLSCNGSKQLQSTTISNANGCNLSFAGSTLTASMTQNLATTGTPSFASLSLINTTSQLVLGTTNTTTITSTAPLASRTYTLPDAGGAANFILSTSGSGQTITGGLTAGTLTVTGASVAPSLQNTTDLGTTSVPFKSLWMGTSSLNQVNLVVSGLAASRTYTLPDAGGAANFILSTSGSGQTITGGLTAGTLTVTGASVAPSLQNTTDLGTTSVPFKSLWMGTSSLNQVNLVVSGLAASRTYTLPDAGGAANFILSQSGATTQSITASASNVLTINGTGSTTGLLFQNASTNKITIKWDSTNGIQIFDGTPSIWLTQNGTVSGVVKTKNSNVLDDGSGGCSFGISGTAAVNIGTGSYAGTISVGNASSTTTALGVLNLGMTGSAAIGIGATSYSGTISVGNASSTTTALGILNFGTSGSGAISIGNASTTTTALGILNLGMTGSAAIGIGATSYSGTISVGNASSTTTALGILNLGMTGSAAIGIGATSYSGTISVGNASSTTTALGILNLGMTGSAAIGIGATSYSGTITIGNSSATLKFGTSPTPSSAGGVSLGSSSLPFASLYLGNVGTNNAQITGTFGGACVLTIPDPGTSSNFIMSTTTANPSVQKITNGFSLNESLYNTGTAGTNNSPSTTVNGSSTVWTTAMIGGVIIFSGGQRGTILTVPSGTSLTIDAAVTIANGTSYTIYYAGIHSDSTGIYNNATATTYYSGILNFNTVSNAATNIGTGTYNGTISVGNASSTTTALGILNLGMTGSAAIGIGATSYSGTISVGNASSTTNALGVLNFGKSGSGAIGIGNASTTTTALGILNLGMTGSAAIGIGASLYSGTISVGNASSTTTALGILNLGMTGSAAIGIGATSYSGTISVGNTSSTLSTLGTLNLNTSGSSAISIGTGSYSGTISVGNTSASQLNLSAGAIVYNSTSANVDFQIQRSSGAVGYLRYNTTNGMSVLNGSASTIWAQKTGLTTDTSLLSNQNTLDDGVGEMTLTSSTTNLTNYSASYTTGTVGTGGIASTTITGSGTTWTSSMIGGTITGTFGSAVIQDVPSTTSLTVFTSLTITNGTSYTIKYNNTNYTSTYNTGTVSTSGSSTTVTGSSTVWTSSMVGGILYGTFGSSLIVAVASNTSLTLATSFPLTITAGSVYYIAYTNTSNMLIQNTQRYDVPGEFISQQIRLASKYKGTLGGTDPNGYSTIGELIYWENGGGIHTSAILMSHHVRNGVTTRSAMFNQGGLTLLPATNQLIFGGTSLVAGNPITYSTTQTTITCPAPSSNRTYTLPDAGSAANFILSTSSSGQTITGGLTAGTLTATGASIAPSVINTTDLGTTSVPFKSLWLGTSSTNQANLIVSGLTASRTYTLPDAGASANFILSTTSSNPSVQKITNGLSINETLYSTGSASQSTTTVTGSGGASWSSAMIGGVIVFSGGQRGTILAASATSLTVNTSQSVSSTTYTIYYGGLHSDSTGVYNNAASIIYISGSTATNIGTDSGTGPVNIGTGGARNVNIGLASTTSTTIDGTIIIPSSSDFQVTGMTLGNASGSTTQTPLHIDIGSSGSKLYTLSISQPAASVTYTLPDAGASASFIMSTTSANPSVQTITNGFSLNETLYTTGTAIQYGSTYTTGTASQSTTTVTGVGTTFASGMVGGLIVFSGGQTGTITAFTDTTHITVSTSQTVTSTTFTIYYGSGNSIKGIGTTFTSGMAGGVIVFSGGQRGLIWTVGSSTTLSVDTVQAVSNTTYTLYYNGLHSDSTSELNISVPTSMTSLGIAADASWNQNNGVTFPLRLRTLTTPAKELFMGYDNTNDCGFIYAMQDPGAGKPLVLGSAVKTGTSTSIRNILDDGAGTMYGGADDSFLSWDFTSNRLGLIKKNGYTMAFGTCNSNPFLWHNYGTGFSAFTKANIQATTPTQIMSLDTSGNLTVSGGVKLPTSGGTQGTLNYYESGSFTVTWSTAPVSGTIQSTVNFVRIGTSVTFSVQSPTSGTANGSGANYQASAGQFPSRLCPGSGGLKHMIMVASNNVFGLGIFRLNSDGSAVVYNGGSPNSNTFGTTGTVYGWDAFSPTCIAGS